METPNLKLSAEEYVIHYGKSHFDNDRNYKFVSMSSLISFIEKYQELTKGDGNWTCNNDCPDIQFGAPCCHPNHCVKEFEINEHKHDWRKTTNNTWRCDGCNQETPF